MDPEAEGAIKNLEPVSARLGDTESIAICTVQGKICNKISIRISKILLSMIASGKNIKKIRKLKLYNTAAHTVLGPYWENIF